LLTHITGSGSAQAPVAERPLALPPEKGSAIWPHPTVLACAVRTVQASRQCAAIEDRVVAAGRQYMTMMVTSREAIAHSRQLLVDLNAAHGPFFFRAASSASTIIRILIAKRLNLDC
jgi:hypothetical protein